MKKVKNMRTQKGATTCFYMAFVTTLIILVVAFACLKITMRIEGIMNADDFALLTVTSVAEGEYSVSVLGKNSKLNSGQAVFTMEMVESFLPNEVFMAFEGVKLGVQQLEKHLSG